MRLSKGFELNLDAFKDGAFEATEASSFSGISRGGSIGTTESQGASMHHYPEVNARSDDHSQVLSQLSSPVYSHEGAILK